MYLSADRKKLTDLNNKIMVMKGGSCGEGIDWHFGIDVYTMIHLK